MQLVCFLGPFDAVGVFFLGLFYADDVFPWSLLSSWFVSLVTSLQLVCFLGPFVAVGVFPRFLRSSWCVPLVPS